MDISIGQKYNYLTVIRILPQKPYTRKEVECICDCGNKTILRVYDLIKGNIKTCGKSNCKIHKNILSQNTLKSKNRNKNHYIVKDDYIIGYTTDNNKFYFDIEDLEKVTKYTWSTNSKGYITTNVNHTKMLLHRFIMDADKEDIIDHRNHNKADCRKNNLRCVTNSQNQMNTILRKNNSSGYKGISWHKKHNKWICQIGINGKLKYLGMFDNIEDAIKVRQQAEIKYFGEFRYEA